MLSNLLSYSMKINKINLPRKFFSHYAPLIIKRAKMQAFRGVYMSVKKLLSLVMATSLIVSLPLWAGTESGGGGDASEERVNEIRSDLLTWVKNGGAKGLVLPSDISYEEYYSEMANILTPQKVVISFAANEVSVNGVAKTCRGYFSKSDSRQHIECNIARFQNTSETDQYKLIHHEFAGLANIEKNDGAASDYQLSSQITDFLSRQTVLKLAVKKNGINSSLKKLFTIEFDNNGSPENILMDHSVLAVINSYMSNLENRTPGEPSVHPEFTPSEQTMIYFSSEFPNLIPLTNETSSQTNSSESLCTEITCQVSLMTVRKDGDKLSKSFYVNPVFYKTLTAYFEDMLKPVPAFTPAEYTMVLMVSNLLHSVMKSAYKVDKSINASKVVNDSLNHYIGSMVKTAEEMNRGEGNGYPQFTPAEQTQLLMYFNLVEQTLK
jgi:hypothetical protein